MDNILAFLQFDHLQLTHNLGICHKELQAYFFQEDTPTIEEGGGVGIANVNH